MINVCAACGCYRVDKRIDPTASLAICPDCGHGQHFVRAPLLIVAGASGVGKSTVCNLLVGAVTRAILLDGDILWRAEFNDPASNYRDFFETWLRMAKNIAQSGRPAVLFGAGFGVPTNIEPCAERRYFSSVHYLALTCRSDELRERLRARPAWRASGGDAFIDEQVRFNGWFENYSGTPAVEILDTTGVTPERTAQQVRAWIDTTVASGG